MVEFMQKQDELKATNNKNNNLSPYRKGDIKMAPLPKMSSLHRKPSVSPGRIEFPMNSSLIRGGPSNEESKNNINNNNSSSMSS